MSWQTFLFTFIFTIGPQAHAGRLVDLGCNKPMYEQTFFEKVGSLLGLSAEIKPEKIDLGRGLKSGHSKWSSRQKLEPLVVFYDLNSKKFVTARSHEDGYIHLKHFLDGDLMLPECAGAPVIAVRRGHFD